MWPCPSDQSTKDLKGRKNFKETTSKLVFPTSVGEDKNIQKGHVYIHTKF